MPVSQIFTKIQKICKLLIYYPRYYSVLKNISGRRISNKTIVINTIRRFPFVLHRELFIGLTIAKQGAKVIVLLDDGILKHLDTDKAKYHIQDEGKSTKFLPSKLKPFMLNLKSKFILRLYSHSNLSIIYYSSFLDNNLTNHKKKHIFDTFEIDCSEYALQSTKKYFENAELDHSIPKVEKYYSKSLYNSNVSLAVGKYILETIKPDIFYSSHGIYSLWGACFKYLFNRNITTVVWGGYKSHTKISLASIEFQQLPCSREWRDFSSKTVDSKMTKVAVKHLKMRTEFKTEDTKVIYRNVKQNMDFIRPNNNLTFCAFSNVSWDGDVKERNKVFNGLIDWLEQTVRYFLTSNDKMLFVKSHPSELIPEFQGGSYPIVEILKKRIPEMVESKNIVHIPSDSGINTYEFVVENVDVGLIYDGHLCLELPYLKIPTIVAGNGKFGAPTGFNFHPTSMADYFNLLDNIDSLRSEFFNKYESLYENLIRYVFWYVQETSFLLPTMVSDYNTLGKLNKEDVDIAINPNLKNTIERILGPVRI